MSKILDIWKMPNYCQKNPAPKTLDSWKKQTISWAIFYHVGRNWDSIQFFMNYWDRFPKHHLPDIVFTYHDDQEESVIEEYKAIVEKHKDLCNNIIWIKVRNHGTDIYPFLLGYETTRDKNYLLILKIHSKKSNQEWIQTLADDNLPSADWIDWFLNVAYLRKDVGMICSTSENLDWINTPLLFDYWIRGGIIPRPLYSTDILPKYEEIAKSYENDIDDSFIREYPAPKNQYRKNGLLYDPQVYWWNRENPMGMKTEGHNICNSIQKPPFLMQYFQQIGVNPGTVFWISSQVCNLILNYFPLEQITNELESGGVKDNIWQRNLHTWERFFSSYTLLQGFTVIDTKHKIHFKTLPYDLVNRSFSGWEELYTHFHDRKAVFSQQVPKQFSKNPPVPWFPYQKDRKTIPIGVATGTNSVYPILVRGPEKIMKNKRNPCHWIRNMNHKQWLELTRVPQKDDSILWKHILITNKDDVLQYIKNKAFESSHEKPNLKTPWETIWIPKELLWFTHEQWELHHLFWLLPRTWIETIPEYSTHASLSLWIIEMIVQIAFMWPKNAKLEWINIEGTLPTTLSELFDNFHELKEDLIFFGQGLIKPWLCLQSQSYHNTISKQMNPDPNGPVQLSIRAPTLLNDETWESCINIMDKIQLLLHPEQEIRKSYLVSYIKHTYKPTLNPWNIITPWLKKSATSEVVACNEDPFNYLFIYDTNPLYQKGSVGISSEWYSLVNFFQNQGIKFVNEKSNLSNNAHMIVELHLSPISVSEKIVTIGGIHQQLYQKIVANNLIPCLSNIAIAHSTLNNFVIYTKVYFRANTIGERMLFKPMVSHIMNIIDNQFPIDKIYYSIED